MTFIKGFIIRVRAGRGQCGGLSRHWCQGRSSPAPCPRGAGVLVVVGPGRGDPGRARSLGAARTCRRGGGGREGGAPGGQQVVGRRGSVHQLVGWRGAGGTRGQWPTPGRRDHVRVAVHLK